MQDLKGKVRKIVESRADSLWTAAIGTVTKAGTRTVDVQIKNKILVDEKEEDFPIIKDVPVIFLRTANLSVVSPLEVNDVVLLIFTKYNSKGLLDSASTVLSKDSRQFSLNDCICIPGFFLSSDALPEVGEGEGIIQHKDDSYIKFTSDEMDLEHKSGSYIKFKSDGSIVIYATKVDFNKKT